MRARNCRSSSTPRAFSSRLISSALSMPVDVGGALHCRRPLPWPAGREREPLLHRVSAPLAPRSSMPFASSRMTSRSLRDETSPIISSAWVVVREHPLHEAHVGLDVLGSREVRSFRGGDHPGGFTGSARPDDRRRRLSLALRGSKSDEAQEDGDEMTLHAIDLHYSRASKAPGTLLYSDVAATGRPRARAKHHVHRSRRARRLATRHGLVIGSPPLLTE